MINDVATPVLQAFNISKQFVSETEAVHIFKAVDFALHAGERVAIQGASGSGKTTLLHCLAGLEQVSTGEIFWGQHNISATSEIGRGQLRNECLGFVFQFHHLLNELSALENVTLPALLHQTQPAVAKKRASALLDRVGLGHRLHHKPGHLSGGERQRVALVRALMNQPIFVLADEPTGNLDQHTAQSIQQLIGELSQELGIAFLIVTHDAQFAATSDRIFQLSSSGLVGINK